MISIKINKRFQQLFPLKINELLSSPHKVYNNALLEKDNIINQSKSVSGIYLLHNSVNGKQYVGSGTDLSNRLATYYYPSRLTDNRHISNSILKYGHDSFSVVILEIIGPTNLVSKSAILNKEQHYLDLYKPILNLNPTAGSSLGFKHSEESKRLIAESRTGQLLSEATKLKLGVLFSGELNPFWNKIHSEETLAKMSELKLGELNPMFNKEKSPEFIEQMYRDKSGENNPMFGKTHSEETLTKMRKRVYVYNADTKELVQEYESITLAKKELKMGYDTLKKLCNNNKVFKERIFSHVPLEFLPGGIVLPKEEEFIH